MSAVFQQMFSGHIRSEGSIYHTISREAELKINLSQPSSAGNAVNFLA